jgi:aminoglycoside phosphotransferase (APT) family kinase protein
MMSAGMEHDLSNLVATIVSTDLGETPLVVRRMTTGACNEVYCVELPSRSVVVRMNADDRYLKGSERNIPLFRSLGIKVPEIIASDYSKAVVPYCYQIQSCLRGTDLGNVIRQLTEQQLTSIATNVVEIFHKLRHVATNGKYGYISGDDTVCRESWSEVIGDMIAEIDRRNAANSMVGSELMHLMRRIFSEYEAYFHSVPSTCFYDDVSSKNVLVDDGRFTGIVDLDVVAYGDPLEALGRIKACWFGSSYGKTYLSAIERGLDLIDRQRKVVTMYAVLHRVCWLSEKGIQWNRNTSKTIDVGAVERDLAMIHALNTEMRAGG